MERLQNTIVQENLMVLYSVFVPFVRLITTTPQNSFPIPDPAKNGSFGADTNTEYQIGTSLVNFTK